MVVQVPDGHRKIEQIGLGGQVQVGSGQVGPGRGAESPAEVRLPDPAGDRT